MDTQSGRTLIDVLKEKAKTHPEQKLFFYPPPDFDEHFTVVEVHQRAQRLALGLRDLGLRPGATVGILAASSPAWEITQLAVFMASGIVVGLDPNDTAATYRHIIEKCEIEFLFIDEKSRFEKIKELLDHRKNIQIISLGDRSVSPAGLGWEDLGSGHKDQSWRESLPTIDVPATIVFTSGTTGEPKGIQYRHGQLAYAVERMAQAFPEIKEGSRFVCWLPLSSLYQRMMDMWAMKIGGEIYVVDNPLEIATHLRTLSPDLFAAVPRFYEKIYSGIQSKVAESPLLSRLIFRLALRVGSRYAMTLRKDQTPSLAVRSLNGIFDKLVFQKLRGLFGNRILFMLSGSAPLRKELLEFFHSIGLLILEAYGTSENVIPNACNRYRHYKLGSVGLPLVEDSISISPDGEVWVQGPGVFEGYYKEGSSDKFEGAYYKTGDLGYFDEEGFLYLTGRKGDFIKTSTGLKIPTLAIQNSLQQVPWVDAAVTLGEFRKTPVALVSLDFQNLSSHTGVPLDRIWETEKGHLSPHVLSRIESDLREKLLEIPQKFRPVGVLVLPRKLTLQNNEITPNMKMRRKYIEQKFSKTLDAFYEELEHRTVEAPIRVMDAMDPRIDETTGGSEPAHGMVDRARTVIGLVMRSGLAYARLRLVGGSTDKVHREIGRILREGLGGLKGPLHKVGQMLSYTADQLPSGFKEEMRDLVHDSSPVNPHLIRSIVEAELKKPIPQLFREWNDAPLATGSIGQVHLARLHDGQVVAVKVLLPGIDRIIKTDLFFIRLAVPFVGLSWKTGNLKDLYKELRLLILGECDLAQEAGIQTLFSKIYEGDPDILIPKVYHKYSTSKVLVTEYIDGKSFDEFKHSSTQEEKNKAAEIMWNFVLSSTTRHCIFNADPHPGNYIFKDGKVAFLDFGFCKGWDPAYIAQWRAQTLAGCRGDFEGFQKASMAMGYRNINGPVDFQALYAIYRDIFYRPWIQDQKFQFDGAYMREYLKNMFEWHLAAPGFIVPTELLVLTRLYWGFFAILAELHADANFYRLTMPYLQENTGSVAAAS